jgi:hypothetical protein
MRDAAEDKAERDFDSRTAGRGADRKGIERAATKRATQMENRQNHPHGNHGVPRMDRPPTRPWVNLECLPQNETIFNIQVLTPLSERQVSPPFAAATRTTLALRAQRVLLKLRRRTIIQGAVSATRVIEGFSKL